MVDSFYKLLEGGNVFKGENNQPVTTRISKEGIAPSLTFVEEILGFKLNHWLGTTGKKDSSGDIDVSVDSSKHDKKEIANKLKAWAKSQGLNPAEWVKLSGDNVHFKLPIRNSRGELEYSALKPQYVQLDLMFGNPTFQAWSMRGEPGKFKGMHRHVILASIAKAHGWKWSYKNGLVDRATGKIISQDPKEIVRKLLPGFPGSPDKVTVESILKYVYTKYKNDPKKIEDLIGEAASTLAEQYGVQIPMPNETTVHESNDPDNYFLARLRDRIVNMDMEPLIEQTVLNEGKLRDINHLEDLILDEGPAGLGRAIQILRSFAEGRAHAETTIKWDGSPAIIFGRDEQGKFILTDKAGFAAKGYNGKATSAKELGQMFANRKTPMDDARQTFINNMMEIFNEFKKVVPKDFRGFLAGDLMYYHTPPQKNGAYVMQPNIVRYEINAKSKLGERIGNSKAGIVVHKYIGDQFSSTEDAIDHLLDKNVFIIPPVYVQHPSKINTKPIDKIEQYAKQHANEIKELFNPNKLRGIADIHGLFYKYINNKVDTGLAGLGTDFLDWLNTQKLSDQKRTNIIAYLKKHSRGVKALWTVITGIMKLKDFLVKEFDAHPSDVKQSIGGKPGGEGYVVKHPEGAVKLVPRSTFSAANRAAHR